MLRGIGVMAMAVSVTRQLTGVDAVSRQLLRKVHGEPIFEPKIEGVNSWRYPSLGQLGLNLTFLSVFDAVSDSCETRDGGVLVMGEHSIYGAGKSDICVSKLDSSGRIVWEKVIGGSSVDRGQSIKETEYGEFLIAGYTYSGGIGYSDVLLTKLDATGNLIWAKAIGGLAYDAGYSVQDTKDGGVVVLGYTTSYGPGDFDVLIFKLDSNGEIVWVKVMGGPCDDMGNAIQEMSDGRFVLTGYITNYGPGHSDVLIATLDSNGSLLWAKAMGSSSDDRGTFIQKMGDLGFVVRGVIGTDEPGKKDLVIATLNEGGDIQGYASKVTVMDINPRIIDISPTVTDISLTSTDLYGRLAILDSSGSLSWGEAIGGSDEYGDSIQKTEDGGYVLC